MTSIVELRQTIKQEYLEQILAAVRPSAEYTTESINEELIASFVKKSKYVENPLKNMTKANLKMIYEIYCEHTGTKNEYKTKLKKDEIVNLIQDLSVEQGDLAIVHTIKPEIFQKMFGEKVQGQSFVARSISKKGNPELLELLEKLTKTQLFAIYNITCFEFRVDPILKKSQKKAEILNSVRALCGHPQTD